MSSSLGLQFPVKGSWPAHGHLLRIVIADTTEPFLGPKYSGKFIFMSISLGCCEDEMK